MDLIVRRLSHHYGDLPVLQDIDLTVRAGEIVAIIGPSGCGKSTLLSLMGGILKPQAGEVLLEGDPPEGCLNPLTYVFQDFALLPWESVEGNVRLVLDHHPITSSEREARVTDALERTGLGDYRRFLPKQLSGGMRQRVGIARALVVRPAILFMDEPLSALDAQTRELLMEDFVNLMTSEQLTAAYVTHNLHEALKLADRVVVLSRRPGVVREVVPIDIPQIERGGNAALSTLASIHDRLWGLIKAEAQVAEREVVHGNA